MAASNPSPVHLDVPVTDAERTQAQAQRREYDNSSDILPEPVHQPQEEQQVPPSRFPSIHGPPVVQQLSQSLSQRFGNRNYVPLPDFHEEDEPNSINLRERSVYKLDAGDLPPSSAPIPQLWTPIWLRRSTLGLFALAFALLVVGLTLVWHFDQVNDGFKVSSGMKHYAWAYAPTVVAVVIVALWRMVDYHAKLAMPFDALQNGPLKPSESLFVDYISKFQLVALFEAIKNSHFAVMTTVTGFVLLKVMAVFSTGLLLLLPTQVTQKSASIQALGFSSDAFDPSTALDESSFSPLPVYAYYGSMAQGIPLASGVAFDMAYGVLSIVSNSSLGKDAVISGTVDAFLPLMTCNALDAQLDTPIIVNDTNSAEAFATSSDLLLTIKVGGACTQSSSISVPADNPYTNIVSQRQVTGTIQEIYCEPGNGTVPDSDGPAGLLFTLTDITYQQTLFDNATQLAGGTFSIASNVSRTVTNITNVFCVPSYVMSSVKVTNKTQAQDSDQANTVTLSEGATNSSLATFSAWNATNVFVQSATLAQALFGSTVDDDTTTNSSGIFTLMALTHGSQDIDALLDPDKMMLAAQDTYKGILSQYAHQMLRAANANDVEGGTMTHEESRLRVNDVSVWTMASIFGVLMLFCIALIFIAPRAVAPRDPSSIATVATILTRSTELNRLLSRPGIPSFANQKFALAGFEFGTAITTTDSGRSNFKIVTSEGEPEDSQTKPSLGLKWWLPMTATIPVVIMTFSLPLALIAILEVVQRSSDKHHGIYTVPDNDWTEIYSHYIPTVVMVIIATLVNMLDFNVAMFAPWINLAKGDAISRRSILNHILGRSPPFAFLQAFRTRNVGAALSLSAAALASILTILVSGLYTVEHDTGNGTNVSLTQLDTFNLQWSNSYSSDNGAAAMTDLIMHQNSSYSQFTYEGLVFPEISISNPTSSSAVSTVSGTTSYILPAVRGNLRCEVLPNASFIVNTQQAGIDSAYATDQAFVTASAPLPDSCNLGGAGGTDASVTYENNFELPSGGQGTYAGAQLDLLFGPNASTYGNYGEARGQYIGDNPAVGCPTLAFTFGYFQLNSDDQSPVTTMICYQEIQSLQANVTLKLNTTTIDSNHPPVIQNSTVSLEVNPISTTGAKSFDFRIQNNLANEMTLFNGAAGTPATNPSATNTFDIYFQAIINGTNPHDQATLVGADNQNALIDAINQFYRIYMAQAITTNMRAPQANNSTSSRLSRRQTGTTSSSVTTVTTSRLVQDNNTKMMLQIILGVMTILAAAAWLTTKMRHVLPCNPCTLAGTMSLLAGSDLCYNTDVGLCECCGKPRRRSFASDSRPESVSIHAAIDEHQQADDRRQIIPDGAEWMPQLQFETVFGGQRYSMGWWRERPAIGKGRRFGVDIGVRADGPDDQDWELGSRRPEGPGFSGFMVRGGDRDGRGEYSRFRRRGRSVSPVPSAVETEEMDITAERMSVPMVSGARLEPLRDTERYYSREDGAGGGGPGPATLSRRDGLYSGGEA
ncbi:hypothetical protein PV11_03082 [Exophiala sideris]|uniref:Uncharacterized protein n=1 Tax=Exophiala sideris TaxID=1016849 RepID=A0A0D1ZL93_9EURO|nr:hypothetical protein PV11_03082 [Exophiala sideris]